MLQLSSFSNLSIASPTSQLILQPFRHLTYVTTHSPTHPSLHLYHSSFSNSSYASPTSQALHCSFYNLSVTSPTSQLTLQPFRCFTYITAHSPTLLLLHVQLCSKRMGRLVVVTKVSFNERFTRVNSMRSKALQC